MEITCKEKTTEITCKKTYANYMQKTQIILKEKELTILNFSASTVKIQRKFLSSSRRNLETLTAIR